MPDDVEVSVHDLFAALCERPPLSEEEFRFRIEPLRRIREDAVGFLLARIGEEGADHELGSACLHELARPEDTDRLLEAFRDPRRSPAARAEIAQVLAGVASDRLASLLRPEELAELSALSLETLLRRYRDRAGLAQVVGLYRQSSPEDRRALLESIETATRFPEAPVRLGTALDPLFAEEPDPELRALMIRRLTARPEAASAQALARWATRCRGDERRRVKEALRRLARLGIRTPPRDATPVAWISGADGTGCYNVGIAFPTVLGLRDVVLACIGVEAGLRAVSLLVAVDQEAVSEIRSSLEVGQGIPVAAIAAAAAFRHLHEARRRCEAIGKPLPAGYASVAGYLERPVSVAAAVPAELPVEASRLPLETLLDHPAYASWVFATPELPSGAGAELAESVFASGPAGETDSSTNRRLHALAARATSALEGSEVPRRLAAMLRHQAAVHRLRSEAGLAARAEAAAAEIEDHGLGRSRIARKMMERSLRALGAPGGRIARPETRETFKRALERTGRVRRREVLVLNLAEALSRQAEDLNERLPPAQRMTFEQIERLSLAAAERAATELTRDSLEQERLPGIDVPNVTPRAAVRRRLRSRSTRLRLEHEIGTAVRSETDLDEARARRVAGALVTVALWFAQEVCLRQCREECLQNPAADGRHLFYSPKHPAGLEEAPSLHGPPNFAPAGVATKRLLTRALDESIGVAEEFLRALDTIGFTARGECLADVRRVGEILRRLRMIRTEVATIGEDPASIYSQIEELHTLRSEIAEPQRRVIVAVLNELRPRDERRTASVLPAWHPLERRLRALGIHPRGCEGLLAAIERGQGTAPLLRLLRPLAGARGDRWRRLADRITAFAERSVPPPAVHEAPLFSKDSLL